MNGATSILAILAPAVQKVDSAIQLKSLNKLLCVTRWVTIYLVDNAIHLMNNL